MKIKRSFCCFLLIIFVLSCSATKSNDLANFNSKNLKKSYATKVEEKSVVLNGLGSYIEFEANINENQNCALIISVKNSESENVKVTLKVECDGNYFCTQKLLPLPEFNDVTVNRIAELTKGKHIFKIIAPDAGFSLENIRIVIADETVAASIAHPSLVNPNASKEAIALYEYLCRLQGKAIISGQQIFESNSELNVINEITGKYPAVMGIDLMNYSPAFAERGANGNIIRRAKAWAKQGGIISCCWHWCAPKDLIDEDKPEMRWYDGFRTKATKFDFSKAIKDRTSEEYQLIIRDIDAVAVQLKSLADSNIPVLWRPLHEASGGWFWWGSKGSENYKELYKIMYDRLVNYHKLNNLIWVWNAQNVQWYPGDEYADILAYDVYPGKRTYGTFDSKLQMLQSVTAKSKLCALSENSSLPDIDKLSEKKGLWSWFCTWNGEFIIDSNGNFSDEYTDLATFKKFYANDFVITRDEISY